jgi:NDP-sugar pyrophosphorylase family protein
MHQLARAGVTRIDLCVGHLGELIRVYCEEGASLPPGIELAWHWEDEPLGTAGALRTVPDLDGTFLVMNGDILSTLDYRALIDFHRGQDAVLTIAMRSKRVEIDLGVIESANGLVTGYREKPSLDYDVSMGIYVYEAEALRHLPQGPSAFPELVLALVEAGERVAAFRSDAEWFDIGTPAEYERAMRRVEENPGAFAP